MKTKKKKSHTKEEMRALVQKKRKEGKQPKPYNISHIIDL